MACTEQGLNSNYEALYVWICSCVEISPEKSFDLLGYSDNRKQGRVAMDSITGEVIDQLKNQGLGWRTMARQLYPNRPTEVIALANRLYNRWRRYKKVI